MSDAAPDEGGTRLVLQSRQGNGQRGRQRNEGEALTGHELVQALYRGLLERDPDPQGELHYLHRLECDLARPEALIRDLLSSEEGRTVIWRSTTNLANAMWQAHATNERRGEPLFFLHIMKTGGTALANALRRLIPSSLALPHLLLDHLVVMPPSILASAQLITGHLPYEARELLPQGVPVCTVIRDPVDRTLSHYHHLSNDPTVLAEAPDFSLELFLESPRWRTLCRNYQARQLVHRIDLADAWISFSPPERFRHLGEPFPTHHPLPLQSLFDCTPLEDEDSVLTGRALRHLDDIEFVGVTERLDDVLMAVAQYWHVIPSAGVKHENVASGRLKLANLPNSLAQRIREVNSADQALYERALARASTLAEV